jgi:hypothetical protein
MTPLDFIASLEHGEAKAAALTVYNLMTLKWVEITGDPATLPEIGQTVALRMNDDSGGGETFGFCDGRFSDAWQWFYSDRARWDRITQAVKADWSEIGKTPTHWRSI